MDITLYSQPGCGPCVMVKRALTKERLPYTELNVREDAEAADLLRDLGYNGTPVTVFRDEAGAMTDHFGGYSEALRERLKEVAA